MRRVGNEDGISAGHRNVGRLALFAIPAALGGAACLWIAAAMGWIDLTQRVRLEDRAMNSVGLSAPPSEPIKLISFDDQCLRVDQKFMSSKSVQLFVKNHCDRWLSMPNYLYRVKAPDGTVLDSNQFRFSGVASIAPKERRQQDIWSLNIDQRAASVEVAMIDGQ